MGVIIVLTAALSVTALVDMCAVLNLVPPASKAKDGLLRPKHRSSRTVAAILQRVLCLACLICLAAVLAFCGLRASNSESDAGRAVGASTCLALLLAFSIAINSVVLYLSLTRRSGTPANSPNLIAKCGFFRDVEAAIPLAPVRTGRNSSSAQAPKAASLVAHNSASKLFKTASEEPPPSRTVQEYTKALCITADASSGGNLHGNLSINARPDQKHRRLDRQDSDVAMGRQVPHVDVPEGITKQGATKTGDEEELLDALMRDTVQVLMDC